MPSRDARPRGPERRPSIAAGAAAVRRIRAALLAWYAAARRDLPWRKTRDPYAVWLSETMLQQTRVETVIPYYERFLRALPTVGALAEAAEEQVLALWSGLGYYRRARMLHAAAKRIAREHDGALPRDVAELRALEGVGAYTAGAVASIAYGRRAAVVDGNVARVLARLEALDEDVRSARGSARLWAAAERLLPDGDADPGDWNQALMELGATVCLPRRPRCDACPLAEHCAARARGLTGELPRATPKKKPLVVRRVAIVLASPRAVLLARRRVDVLFGGLWEPPTSDGAAEALAKSVGARPSDLEAAGCVTHVLSHRRMAIDVYRGPLGRRVRYEPPSSDYDAVQAVGWDGLADRAHGALTRKMLEVANVGRGGLRLG